MSKTQPALPPGALQAYRDAYVALFNPEIEGRGHLDSHTAGIRAILALPREPATCGEVGDLIRRLRNWPAISPNAGDIMPPSKVDLLNEAAAALELITSMSIDAKEVENLRGEVGYWRRDLSARLAMGAGLLNAAIDRGETDLAHSLAIQLRSWLASYDSADAGEWHERCELCGEPILPGQASASSEDVSGHDRCVVDRRFAIPDGPDDTDTDLAANAEKARKAMARCIPDTMDEQRKSAIFALAERKGYTLSLRYDLKGEQYAALKNNRTGSEITFVGAPARRPLQDVETWLSTPTENANRSSEHRGGMPFGGQSL